MINLLPPAAHRKIVREYWSRVATTGLFLIGTACLVAMIALLPSYLLIDAQMSSLEDVVSQSSEKVASYDVSVGELASTSDRAKLLLEATAAPFTSYQKIIEQLGTSEIQITSLRFNRPEKKPGTVTVDGVAANRQVLAAFRDSLSTQPDFVRVDLPISNLIKDQDIQFSIQITTATTSAKSI